MWQGLPTPATMMFSGDLWLDQKVPGEKRDNVRGMENQESMYPKIDSVIICKRLSFKQKLTVT